VANACRGERNPSITERINVCYAPRSRSTGLRRRRRNTRSRDHGQTRRPRRRTTTAARAGVGSQTAASAGGLARATTWRTTTTERPSANRRARRCSRWTFRWRFELKCRATGNMSRTLSQNVTPTTRSRGTTLTSRQTRSPLNPAARSFVFPKLAPSLPARNTQPSQYDPRL
jgi:hypothetical protein